MEREKIVIELCGGKMPKKAHDADAAYDVFTSEDYDVNDWGRHAVPLGFKIQLPKHLAALIQARSGMSLYGIPAVIEYLTGESKETRINADVELGLIDSQYTGMVSSIIKAFNLDILVKRIYIPKGTKIAQMRIVEIPNTELVSGVIKKEENDDKENGDKKRGDNGFNSTGVK